ncbi:bifunctional RNase H/acid phosphatase [Nakamurella flavida]
MQSEGTTAGVGTVTMYADGGSRGNPGPAGYGSVVFDRDGAVLAERAASVGRATNNVAEYSGLIAGLEAARDLGARRVDVRMDSKLVVEQMSGRWQVKHPDMKPLARKASGLVAGFDTVTFTWVPRAQNSHADRLANEAMDATRDGGTWTEPGRAPAPAPLVEDGLFGPDGTVGEDGPDPAAALPDPHPSGATQVIVVRHGETVWGAQGRFVGRKEVPLSARGEAQAAALAQRLRKHAPAVVLSSPLGRCRATAEAIATATGAPMLVEDALLDGKLGDWSGRRPGEIAEGWPAEFAVWRSDPDAAPPGGESFQEIRDRVSPLLGSLAEQYRGHTVVLVTHAATSKMLLTAAMDAPTRLAYRFRIDTASMSGITVEDDGDVVVWAVNETGHLS